MAQPLHKSGKKGMKLKAFYFNIKQCLAEQPMTFKLFLSILLISILTPSSFSAVLTDSLNMKMVSVFPVKDYAYGLYIDNDLAYIANYSRGLRIIDISDPFHPEEISFINSTFWARNVIVSGGYAYYADRDNGFVIVDVSNPSKPAVKSIYDFYDYPEAILLEGNTAYIAVNNLGINVLDISDKSKPVLVSSGANVGRVKHFAKSGNFLYTADYDYGLSVVDVSSLKEIKWLSLFKIGSGPIDIALQGKYLFVAGRYRELFMYDISIPQYPKILDTLNFSTMSWGVYVFNNLLFVATGEEGVRAYSFINDTLELKGYYNTPSVSYDVIADKRHIYVADGLGGMVILNSSLLDATNDSEESVDLVFSPKVSYNFISGEISVSIDDSNNYIRSITLFDASGKIQTEYDKINERQFSLSQDYLMPGIYFLNIRLLNGNLTKKVILF